MRGLLSPTMGSIRVAGAIARGHEVRVKGRMQRATTWLGEAGGVFIRAGERTRAALGTRESSSISKGGEQPWRIDSRGALR